MVEFRPLNVPLSHANDAEHRRLLAIRTNLNIVEQATTFTPALAFATPGDLSNSYAMQDGFYYRQGSLVFVFINLVVTPTFTTAAGAASITGLPLTVASDAVLNVLLGNVDFSGVPFATASGSALSLNDSATGTALSTLTAADFTTATSTTIQISGFYPTND